MYVIASDALSKIGGGLQEIDLTDFAPDSNEPPAPIENINKFANDVGGADLFWLSKQRKAT
ncbi:MAG: hypothetical protein HYR68_04495 [Burkholderiales bacterium]|nr:hypothetical protein [Burkholderiales bacterium]MBI3731619.1 hypothetical protein [Burkholderiales bacterium]